MEEAYSVNLEIGNDQDISSDRRTSSNATTIGHALKPSTIIFYGLLAGVLLFGIGIYDNNGFLGALKAGLVFPIIFGVRIFFDIKEKNNKQVEI